MSEINEKAKNTVKLLREKGKKVSSAESCTGGLISAAITSVSGASEVFEMGICSYANRIKSEFLCVPDDILEKFGAVSEEVALAMANGVKNAAKSDYGVSTTGIAGPSGGSPEKPVGTVWIGVCSQRTLRAEKFVFSAENCPNGISERDHIRLQAALKALEILENEIISCDF